MQIISLFSDNLNPRVATNFEHLQNSKASLEGVYSFFHSVKHNDKLSSPVISNRLRNFLWVFTRWCTVVRPASSNFKDTVSPKRKYTLLSSQVLKTEGGQMKRRRCAKPTKISTPTAWKSMGIFEICDISQERLPQTFCSCVAIFVNFKMRLGPVWTNSMVGVAHPLLFL